MEIGKDLAKQLLDIIQGTKDFVIEQAPDVVRQLVSYQLISAVAYGVIGLAFLVWSIFLGKKLLKFLRGDHIESSEADVVVAGASGVGAIVFGGTGIIVFLSNIHDVLLWWLAPKVALLQYLKSFL